jgi:hypothetical protein
MACIGHFDQRLFDEALSIIKEHPGIVRVPFIKYWSKMMDPDSQFRLYLMLDFCKISKLKKSKMISPPENFFKNVSQKITINGQKLDPYFKQFGFKRNLFSHSSHVPSLRDISDINPFVKMRLSSGFQAQSDIWVYLLYFKELTVPKIQSLLGVTAKSAWNILQNMHQAGWVTKKSIGKVDRYQISNNANKSFSYIKTSKLHTIPVDWIKLGHHLSVIGDKMITEKYLDFLNEKFSRKYSELEMLEDIILPKGPLKKTYELELS